MHWVPGREPKGEGEKFTLSTFVIESQSLSKIYFLQPFFTSIKSLDKIEKKMNSKGERESTLT